MQLVGIVALGIVREVCGRGIIKTASLTTGWFTYTEIINNLSPFSPIPAPSVQSSPSTGHSHHIRASSLDKQVLEAGIENNSVFLGHSSISHKHCNKYSLSRLRGFFWNCFTTSLTDTGYFITLSSESLQEFTPWANWLLAAGVHLLLHCSLIHFKFLACVCFKSF